MIDKFGQDHEPEEIKPSDANSESRQRRIKRSLSFAGKCHKPQSPAELLNYSCKKCKSFNL